MPVIGRLDDQVDAVLIKPLAGKDAPDGDVDARTQRDYQNITRPQTATPTTDENDSPAHTRPRREELPVWLL
jgi:hypothetical protein